MSNPATLIAEGWKHIESDHDFCCDERRELLRHIYFAGAMNALACMTDWDPTAGGLDLDKRAVLIPACVELVREELNAAWVAMESLAEGAGHA